MTNGIVQKPRSCNPMQKIILKYALAVGFLCYYSGASAQNFSQLSLEEVASGLSQPVAVVPAGDGSNRLFIVEQAGRIQILEAGASSVNPTSFLDIRSSVNSNGTEQGLLGLVFHPDYSSNGLFYVNYISGSGNGRTVVAQYAVSSGDPNVAENDETRILEVVQPWTNHNGGDLQFGPDGYLYVALGDGGRFDDVFLNAQNINTLHGAILRVDVNGSPGKDDVLCGLVKNYGIPAGNPFTDKDGCDEIWSYGLRNPWRFSFYRDTGDMFIGDVGQGSWEEINFEPADTAGVNYGWSCREGAHDFNGDDCVTTYVDPILEYNQSGQPCSVTGGYIYRGIHPSFDGYYFYGDYCSHQIWLARDPGTGWSSSEWVAAASELLSISSFGEDEAGELYIADRNAGKIFHIKINDDIFADGFESLP